MMWQHFFMALGLAMVFEGIFPFLNPERWQKVLKMMSSMPPHRLRWVGFGSMLVGVTILTVIHWFFFDLD